DVRVIQQPEDALVTVAGKEKSRKPIDPPPMYQIELYKGVDPQKHFYRNPYVFGTVTLIYEDKDEPYRHNGQDPLTGTLVSSLHCLKNHENKEGGFFIFGDISVKVVGRFRLRFSIHEVVPDDCAWYLGGAISEPFDVSLPKDYRGLKESTYLSRAFSDQGVRLRLRKDTRGGAGMKRPPPDDEGQN
ncbi:velvet factor, partial [Paraphoma chrysanthemicola]